MTDGVYALEPGASSKPEPGRSDPESEHDLRRDAMLVCRTCGRMVAHRRLLFVASGGSPIAVFANPHGRVFEITTLLSVEGLLFVGSPTADHTWFPGYAWRVAVCGGCGTHLGWSFEASSEGCSPTTFFGLLTAEILDQGDD